MESSNKRSNMQMSLAQQKTDECETVQYCNQCAQEWPCSLGCQIGTWERWTPRKTAVLRVKKTCNNCNRKHRLYMPIQINGVNLNCCQYCLNNIINAKTVWRKEPPKETKESTLDLFIKRNHHMCVL